MTASEFEDAARGLRCLYRPDLSARVVAVEPIGADYFRDETRRQRCIVETATGERFVSFYD